MFCMFRRKDGQKSNCYQNTGSCSKKYNEQMKIPEFVAKNSDILSYAKLHNNKFNILYSDKEREKNCNKEKSDTSSFHINQKKSEELKELKYYTSLIERQKSQIVNLQKSHDDLEHRLEEKTRLVMDLEEILEKKDKIWSNKFEKVISERDARSIEIQVEQKKNERLLDLIYTQNKEIHRMFQRKYDSAQVHGQDNRDQIQNMPRISFDRGLALIQQFPRDKETNIYSTHRYPHDIVGGQEMIIKKDKGINSLIFIF